MVYLSSAHGEIYAPSEPSSLLLAARGGHSDCCRPEIETFNMQLIESDGSNKIVVWDRGFAANGFIRKFGNE